MVLFKFTTEYSGTMLPVVFNAGLKIINADQPLYKGVGAYKIQQAVPSLSA